MTDYTLDAYGNPARVVYPAAGNGRRYARGQHLRPRHPHHGGGLRRVRPDPGRGRRRSSTHGTVPDRPGQRGHLRLRWSTTPGCRWSPPAPTPTGTPPATRYDGLGRLTRVTLPSGAGTGTAPGEAFIGYHYAPQRTARPDGRTRRPSTTSPGTVLITTTFTDGLGRTIQTKTPTALHQPGTGGTGAGLGFTVSGAAELRRPRPRRSRTWQPTYEPYGASARVQPRPAPRLPPATTTYNVLDEPLAAPARWPARRPGHPRPDESVATSTWTYQTTSPRRAARCCAPRSPTTAAGPRPPTPTPAARPALTRTSPPGKPGPSATSYHLDALGQLPAVVQAGQGPTDQHLRPGRTADLHHQPRRRPHRLRLRPLRQPGQPTNPQPTRRLTGRPGPRVLLRVRRPAPRHRLPRHHPRRHPRAPTPRTTPPTTGTDTAGHGSPGSSTARRPRTWATTPTATSPPRRPP